MSFARTFIYHYSNMVWNVVFSNINNEITGVGYRGIESSVVISCVVVKKVKVGVVHPMQLSVPRLQVSLRPYGQGQTYAATSA